MDSDNQIPFNRAFLWILVSVLLISGSAFMGWLYYLHARERCFQDDQYRIVAILQSNPEVDSIRTVFLTEVLNLSLDRPINLYQFNTQEAVKTLLSHPVIKKAAIKKILPGTLYVSYRMRTPVAHLGNYSNTLMDAEGFLFPNHPFYTSKSIPKIYLQLDKEECVWGSCMKNKPSFSLALAFLKEFAAIQQDDFVIKELDVMQAQADSYGKRQIVAVIDPCYSDMNTSSHANVFVRFSSEHYSQQLVNFHTLFTSLVEKKDERLTKVQDLIIDLRNPHLAFIKPRQ